MSSQSYEPKKTKIPFEWEEIYEFIDLGVTRRTNRAKVYGGWIVKDTWWNEDSNTYECISMCTVFVADPNHEWSI